VTLERNIGDAERALGRDGKTWRRLFEPLASRWAEFAQDILQPIFRVPRHPWLMARFGPHALMPATTFANRHFREARTKALFAGMAAHSFLALDEMTSAGVGMVLAITAHSVGWPIPRGGAQAITNALLRHFETLGGSLKTSSRVDQLEALGEFNFALCDVTPRELLRMAKFAGSYSRILERYRYGSGVFKVDYALSSPIPWRATDCGRASTVHVGGTVEEIAASEKMVRAGEHPERPFLLVSQPTLCDPSRAPEGKHVAWVYCHVPNGSTVDMLPRIEAQMERFAPAFRDCVLARRVWSPADLEARDANLIGGDIIGGATDWRQFFLRPTWRQYATARRDVFLCSASTPPGGGVHGMCGYNAASIAVKTFS